MKKPEPTFQVVAKERATNERKSAVFFYLKKIGFADLLENKKDLIVGCANPSNRLAAFIFNLNLKNKKSLLVNEGYVLQERHIRIDEKFNKTPKEHKYNLLTQWHYTETHSKSEHDSIGNPYVL